MLSWAGGNAGARPSQIGIHQGLRRRSASPGESGVAPEWSGEGEYTRGGG